MNARYVASRAVSTLLMLVGIVVITFLLTHVIPADPARVAAGLRATPQQVAAVRHALGFDDPLYVQFGDFLQQLVHGDFGRSFLTMQPVTSDIALYFPATLELVLCAMFLIVVLGIAAGTYVALVRHPALRVTVKIVALLAMGAPVFLTALLAQIVFFGHLGWLPGQDRISGAQPTSITGLYLIDSLVTLNFRALGSSAVHLILPAGTLALSRVGVIMRFVEDQLTTVMRADYVRTARAKGVSERAVVWRHAMRNALIPVVTMVGLQFGWLLGGSVLVESIYAWPGLGNYMVTSINALDFQPVIGTAVVLGAAFAVINFLVDIVQQLLDPRIAHD
jgi:peptide/nickel transport system permease protein